MYDFDLRGLFALMWVGLVFTVLGAIAALGCVGYVMYRGLTAIF